MADMIQKSLSKETDNAFGEKLSTPIKYFPKWTEFPDFATLVAAGESLSEAKQVKVVNRMRKAAADQSAKNEALAAAGYEKKTAKNDLQIRLRDAVKLIRLDPTVSEADARERASTLLGIAWEDSEDDE